MNEITTLEDPNVKKSKWTATVQAIRSPMATLTQWSSKSPLVMVLTVVFLLQPVISTGIDLIKEVRTVSRDFDPGTRPITKSELDIVNKKIDFLQELILAQIAEQKARHESRRASRVVTPEPTTEMRSLDRELDTVQKKLDTDYENQAKKQ